jgi:E3 ubiquitin-protein ligase NRDP1
LGVCLNMKAGTLSYSLDGEYFGIAYTDERLRVPPIYPAISFLTQGGCIVDTSKPPPACFV